MSDLKAFCAAAIDVAAPGEQVEAYAEENRHTEVRARGGEVEGLTFSESRGLGVRVVRDGRVGFAYVADPDTDEAHGAVATARENALLAEPDDANGLPEDVPAPEPMPGLYRERQASMPVEDKVSAAVAMERRATSIDPRVTNCDDVVIADAVGRIAVASTAGIEAEMERTDSWCYVIALAVEGDETQTGYSFKVGRQIDELGWEEVAEEAVRRATSMIGATKPPSARMPVVLDPFAGSGTTGLVAGQEGRNAVLIELNPEYIELQRQRTAQIPMLAVQGPQAQAIANP